MFFLTGIGKVTTQLSDALDTANTKILMPAAVSSDLLSFAGCWHLLLSIFVAYFSLHIAR